MISKTIAGVSITTSGAVVDSTWNRNRRRSAILIQNAGQEVGYLRMSLEGWYVILKPGDSFHDEENSRGEIYQGAYFATPTSTWSVVEDLYA